MKIAILGAGGVGGYLAAKLTEAGTPVALIARGTHLETIRAQGLKLIEPDGTTVTRPEVLTDDPRAIGTPDVLVVTVKAHQLAQALEQIAPAVGPETLVVTVQNGVDAPEMAAEVFGPARVAICVARILSNITGPGEITRYGAPRSFTIGGMDGGQGGAVARLRASLAAAGVDVPDCDDVRVDLWSKFLLFNAISSTTAGARTRVGTVRDTPALAALAHRLIAETFEVARAEGIALPEDAVETVWDYFVNETPAEARASTAHDLELGRALEIDHTCGSVARRGRALGVDVTASETVYALLAPFKLGTPG